MIWSGGPKAASVPGLFKVAAAVAATMSLVAVAFAVVVATGLHLPVGDLLVFGGWSATLALASWRLPLWFRSTVRYVITTKHVIWQRGRLRRSIERDAISYAIIRWSPTTGIGDLVLARTSSGRSFAGSSRARPVATGAARSRSGSTTGSASSGLRGRGRRGGPAGGP